MGFLFPLWCLSLMGKLLPFTLSRAQHHYELFVSLAFAHTVCTASVFICNFATDARHQPV